MSSFKQYLTEAEKYYAGDVEIGKSVDMVEVVDSRGEDHGHFSVLFDKRSNKVEVLANPGNPTEAQKKQIIAVARKELKNPNASSGPVHESTETSTSLLLNKKIKPEKVFPEDKQGPQFRKFGAAVEAMVEKYSKFNGKGDSIPASSGYGNSTARASRSAEIEFTDSHHDHGGAYGFSTSGRFAVKLGSIFPKDKTEEFAKDYIELVKKELPTEIPVRESNKEIKQHKTRIHVSNGTNFHTIMVTF